MENEKAFVFKQVAVDNNKPKALKLKINNDLAKSTLGIEKC